MTLQTLLNEADVFSKSGYSMMPENASLADRLLYGLKVAVIGIAVVFIVLILLWFILAVFRKISERSIKEGSGKAPEENQVVSPQAAGVAPTASATDEPDEETVVILATAAIAAMRNSKDAAFKVISVKKLQ